MTETKTHEKSRVPPSEAASPLFTFGNVMRDEMQRIVDESASAAERTFVELERSMKESERIATAQLALWRDATRAATSMWRSALSG